MLAKQTNDGSTVFWCPGCQEHHHIDSRWQISGLPDNPTFSPSVLTWLDPNPNALPEYDPTGKYRNGFRCHSFVRNGQIEYLSDCTHELAGKTVPMIALEEVR